MRSGFAWLSCAALCVSLMGTATAQVAPQATAGAIGNEQQRQQQKIENAQPQPQTAPQNAPVTAPAPPTTTGVPAAPGVTFVLKAVSFDPSNFLSPGDLDAIAHDYVGKTVSFDDLAAIVGRVNALYKEKGQVTARAILPPQKIADGVVHIALIEGKLGRLDVKGAQHMDPDYVRDRIAVRPGDVVDVSTLTSDVVFFNRTNDAQVRALLKPGEEFGQTDVELDLTEPPPDRVQVFLDNQGVDSTGREEGGLYYRHSNLFADGDRTTLYGTISRGGLDGSVAYDIPFDEDGDRLTASYDRNHIDILEGQFSSLGIKGSGQTASAGVTRPLVGTEDWLVTASFNGLYGTSSTKEPAGPVTNTLTYRAVGGLSATYISRWLFASVSPSFAYADSHDSIQHKDRSIEIFSGSGLAITPLGGNWSVHLATAWQYSPQSLLPADLLFQIGGPTSVRGFLAGTFAGDSGYYANAELHHEFDDISKGLDLFLFYDTGMVFSTSPSERSLNAIGVGGSFSPVPTTTFSVNVGVPLDKAIPHQDGYQFYLQFSARL